MELLLQQADVIFPYVPSQVKSGACSPGAVTALAEQIQISQLTQNAVGTLKLTGSATGIYLALKALSLCSVHVRVWLDNGRRGRNHNFPPLSLQTCAHSLFIAWTPPNQPHLSLDLYSVEWAKVCACQKSIWVSALLFLLAKRWQYSWVGSHGWVSRSQANYC